MIKRVDEEYLDGDRAVKTVTITIFGIPIFKDIHTTTDNRVTECFIIKKELKKIKGFNYENEN